MDRRKERDLAFKLLYEMTIKKEEEPSQAKIYLQREGVSEGYIPEVIERYLENKEEILALIQTSSKKWDVSRILKLDITILKLALAEILYMQDIPMGVSINEAVKLAKKYSGEDSYKFVNGILKQATVERGLQ
ncbi:transcription antitermination factor NusB [Filifactor villosus]|uniref:Transcription antitermination protein NusB n=1 Tax=Filifactor villosus TaxID=29374 RepID=A0ABV9QNA5_9FIRM